PVEDHVVGGEGGTVVPRDVLLQLPRYRPAISRYAAVVAARYLGGEDGLQDSLGVETHQTLVEQVRRVRILVAGCEVRIHLWGRLPVQQSNGSAAAAFRWFVCRIGRRQRDACIREQQRCERSRDSDGTHPREKSPARQMSTPNAFDHSTDVGF